MTVGNQLLFYFSGTNPDVPLNPAGNIAPVVDQVCGPNYPFTDLVDPFATFNLAKPWSSTLSLEVYETSYVIFKLSDKRWQFARRGYPVTVGTATDARYFCCDAFRCSSTGYNGKDPGIPYSPPGTPRDDCNVVFFIADGKGARANADDGEYDHSYNLHVDLIFPPDPAIPNDPIRRMPITIDPDVRYPGGSE